MKGKVLAAAVLVMLGMALLLNRQQAKACANSVIAFDDVFAALNLGEVDRAAISFAEDATAENMVRAEIYYGASEIRQMLDEMEHEGRRFNVVEARVDDDTVTAKVEVSDHGFVWGTETIEATIRDNKVQTFTVKAFRLELWRIGRG